MPRMISQQPGNQPNLIQPSPKTPQWAHLPPEVRQQTLLLLAQLLRQHRHAQYAAVPDQEVRDE